MASLSFRKPSFAYLVLFLLLHAPSAQAKLFWQPFVTFFPYYAKNYRPTWGDQCDAFFKVDHSAHRWCENSMNCILEGHTEAEKINMAGASIVLGLTPTILGIMGAKIEDLAFLSSYRPMLSIVLAAGTPTTSMTYPFSSSNPLDSIITRFGSAARFGALKPNKPGWLSNTINLLEYILGFAAAANMLHMSYDISQRTVVSWSCPNVIPDLHNTVISLVYKFTNVFTVVLGRWLEYNSCRAPSYLDSRLPFDCPSTKDPTGPSSSISTTSISSAV